MAQLFPSDADKPVSKMGFANGAARLVSLLVCPGPAPGAFFGVMNVITRRGRDLAGVEVSTAAGSQDT